MSSFSIRRAWIAVAATAVAALSAAPAQAAVVPVQLQLPCLPGLTCPSEEPSVDACPNEALVPAIGNLGKIRRATLCLLNRERTSRGLGALRGNRALRGVATRYAKQMAAKDFFAHVAPNGSTFVDRIRRSSYLSGANGYDVGENLAWSADPTPAQIVSNWMLSPAHRDNILKAAFRDIGIGIALGLPVPGLGSGATYVNEFGRRG